VQQQWFLDEFHRGDQEGAVWPVILTCLGGCLLAAGSVWLYEIEHALDASDESARLQIAAAARADSRIDKNLISLGKRSDRRPNRNIVVDPPHKERRPAASTPAEGDLPTGVATADFRNFSDAELVRQALVLGAELRVSESEYHDPRFGRHIEGRGKTWNGKEKEFRRELLSQAISLANEIVFRLGTVEVPSDVRSLSIKLGAAVVASGKPAGAIPMSPVASYLIFLTRKLPPSPLS
jgi:hypothetical protein